MRSSSISTEPAIALHVHTRLAPRALVCVLCWGHGRRFWHFLFHSPSFGVVETHTFDNGNKCIGNSAPFILFEKFYCTICWRRHLRAAAVTAAVAAVPSSSTHTCASMHGAKNTLGPLAAAHRSHYLRSFRRRENIEKPILLRTPFAASHI